MKSKKSNKKRTGRATGQRHKEYLEYINSIMRSGIVDTKRIQSLLNLSYDVNISKRSIRKFKRILKEKPKNEKPNNACDLINKEIEQDRIKNDIKTLEIKEKISERQLKKDLKKHKMCKDVNSELLFYWSSPCPHCGHCAKIYAGSKSQYGVCAQCCMRYDRETDSWHDMR